MRDDTRIHGSPIVYLTDEGFEIHGRDQYGERYITGPIQDHNLAPALRAAYTTLEGEWAWASELKRDLEQFVS